MLTSDRWALNSRCRERSHRLGGRTLIESVSVLVDKAIAEALGDIHRKEA
ncbi:hypothetical protein [Mycobacterium sp. OTB74]|nr:hypothetical protein [Mycobacterium sp. OTB74]MDH6244626.1 hypothetical protein [Mycobacterium sp. OTB74]